MNKKKCTFINVCLFYWILYFNIINNVQGLYQTETIKEKDKLVETSSYIEAIEGRTALLTCPLIAPASDKIYMVLWFRDDAGIPLYSIDARGKSLSQGLHWSDPKVFGTRAKFIVNGDPAYLELKDIKRHDQGVYRCRVDFKKSQTNSFKFNLTVIIPPEHPVVLDGWGRQLNSTTIGPKEEGDDVTLTCRVIGGRPQPQVRWLINGLLVDDQFEQNSGNVIENRLLWPSIKRHDLHSIFTCQAVNTHLMEPKEKSYVLDMYLKPLTVNITNSSLVLVAERKYEVICETTGSKPEALIAWFKGKKQLKKSKENFITNKTVSELTFVPTFEDDGNILICRSENTKVTSFFMETSVKLQVKYPPVLTLSIGSTLDVDNIKEGEDVYFECHIKSNPSWRKLEWLLDGLPLIHNASAKVIRSNQSLVLQKVNRQSGGIYQCSAINSEGETRSNEFKLRVQFAPLCKFDKMDIIGASKSENILLNCDVFTDPLAKKFRWKFENAEESIEINSDRFTYNGSSSVLHYTPIADQDFGTLSCWATNDVGSQLEPCTYQVILAGLPSPVKNCTWFNETQQSLSIHCQSGYDGGLPQIFIIDVISMNDRISRFNLTNLDEPKFVLNSLKFILSKSIKEKEYDILKMYVYSINQKGRSEGQFVREFLVGNIKKNVYPESSDGRILSPFVIGIIITLFLLGIIIIKYYIKFKKKKRREQERFLKDTKDSKCSLLNHDKKIIPKWQQRDRTTKTLIDFDFTDDEKEPDVISYPRFSSQKHDELIPMTSSVLEEKSDSDVNIKSISDLLMSTRVPESCV